MRVRGLLVAGLYGLGSMLVAAPLPALAETQPSAPAVCCTSLVPDSRTPTDTSPSVTAGNTGSLVGELAGTPVSPGWTLKPGAADGADMGTTQTLVIPTGLVVSYHVASTFARLVATDAQGNQRWQAQLTGWNLYGTLVYCGGVVDVAIRNQGYAFDAASGKQLWSEGAYSPICWRGLMPSSEGWRNPRTGQVVRPLQAGKTDSSSFPFPGAVIGDTAFGGSPMSRMDLSTGRVIWTSQLATGGGPVRVSGDYVVSLAGEDVVIVDARNGAILRRYSSTVYSLPPAVVDGDTLVMWLADRQDDHYINVRQEARSLSTGALLWQRAFTDATHETPVAAGGLLYSVTRDSTDTGRLTVQDERTGAVLDDSLAVGDLGANTVAAVYSAAAGGDHVFIATPEGLWTYALTAHPAPTQAPPAPAGVVAVGEGSGSFAVTALPPAADGGDPITSYLVHEQPQGRTWSFTGTDDTAAFHVTGLGPGPHTFTVQAVSAAGTSAASAPSTSATSDDPIADKYQQLGGTASFLGARVAEVAMPGGREVDYAGGAIYWSSATGAQSVHGAILQHYRDLQGPLGLLGFPTTDETGTPDRVGRFNHFAHDGSIYWTAATGAHEVHGAIRDKWMSLGWEAGPLGYPVTDQRFDSQTNLDNNFNNFTAHGAGAAIYWSASTGAHVLQGAILAHWRAIGAERAVGLPTTDELPTPDGVGRFNHFSGDGSIYWTPMTGAHAVQGAIRDHWAALGWERGPLGYPTTDQLVTPDGVGKFNHFTGQGGYAASIYVTPSGAPWEVQGAIRQAWAAQGWERGRLGYPSSDEYAVPGGRRSNFAGGSLTFSFATGKVSAAYS